MRAFPKDSEYPVAHQLKEVITERGITPEDEAFISTDKNLIIVT